MKSIVFLDLDCPTLLVSKVCSSSTEAVGQWENGDFPKTPADAADVTENTLNKRKDTVESASLFISFLGFGPAVTLVFTASRVKQAVQSRHY